jgi:pimeloyl-ACP methyl ester carboxylesterase
MLVYGIYSVTCNEESEVQSMTKPYSAFVDTENVRLHYLEWNPASILKPSLVYAAGNDESDDLPLVLLHGLNSTADTWRLVAQYLVQHHLVLAFDLRGHGLSEQASDGYDLVTISEDVISGMARLGLGQIALAGHGWGARVALLLAARHPALVSHLMLVDCPHIEPRHWPGMTRERFIHEREIPPQLFRSKATYLHSLRREMFSFWSPEVESIFFASVRENADGSLEERLQADHQRMIRESLWEDRALTYYSKLSCPVLLVPAAAEPQPDDELPKRLEQAEEYAAAKGQIVAQVSRTIPCCSVVWMPNTAHHIQLQRPQVLAQAIFDFLQIEHQI